VLMKALYLLPAVLSLQCRGQISVPETHPEPNNAYAYIRTEIKALRWIREALTQSQKFHPLPSESDPERMHKSVELYTTAETVSDDYNCAVSLLTAYRDSRDEHTRESVNSFLLAIATTRDINVKLIGLMESVNKAQKAEDIDQVGIAKLLANVKVLQKEVAQMSMLAAKMSTTGIMRFEGDGDDAKPIAFTITAAQHGRLLTEIQELANAKKGELTFVDGCAEIILDAVKKQLRTSAP
jgi:hypothetical protein